MRLFNATTRTWAVLNDLQIPFEDTAALHLVLDFIDDLRPYGVVLNGDVVDCYSISDFTTDPQTEADLKTEIARAGKLMQRLSKVASVRIWLGGNHEDRLRRLSWKHVPQLAATGVLDFANVFRTAENGFEYRPYGSSVELGRLIVTHGDMALKHSAYTAKAAQERYGNSVLIGHTHRLGVYYKRDVHGVHAAYENGCLCRLNPEYVQHPNWQQGFSVVHVDERNGFFNVQQIPVLPGPCFYYGSERVGKSKP